MALAFAVLVLVMFKLPTSKPRRKLMSDPRKKALTDAYIQFIEESKYNRHYSGVPEQAVMESRLFLKLYDTVKSHDYKALRDHLIGRTKVTWGDSITVIGETPEPEGRAFKAGEEIVIIDGAGHLVPIPMILFCPACGNQHIDREEEHNPHCAVHLVTPLPCTCGRWTNPPHRSHLCAGCGHIWRPSDVRTAGVAEIATQGSHDTPDPVRGHIGHLPTAKPDCMFIRCPSPTLCTKGCKHVRQLDKLGQMP
jgi:predicted RNA-binding Zn-ribbon protein involved in translation (DUF1610 family)